MSNKENPYKIPSGQSAKLSRYEETMQKLEKKGYRAANKVHRWFINLILLYMAYSCYTFIKEYNAFWRLRRDSNLPKEWLEDAPDKRMKDWESEKARILRDKRIKEGSGQQTNSKVNDKDTGRERDANLVYLINIE